VEEKIKIEVNMNNMQGEIKKIKKKKKTLQNYKGKKKQVSWHNSPGWPLHFLAAPPLIVSEGGSW